MSTPASIELPKELVQQYKTALGKLTDIRLVILLAFSSFEEVMKSFLAWRLSCAIDQLPNVVTRTSDFLFRLVLLDQPSLLKVTQQFAELRNNVAHKFHRDAYDSMLVKFIESVSETSCPFDDAGKRTALIEGVFTLAVKIAAAYVTDIPARSEFPFPMLSMELAEA